MAIFLFIGRFVTPKMTIMKVEQLLVQYLYKNKTVSIQDIGSFSISPDVVLPAEGDKDNSLPEGAIRFSFDKKTLADDGLIDYIKEQSGKIRPLAASDLESYTILTRQFLNIGKPLFIEGLGTLQKNQQGTLDFTQGTSSIITRAEIPQNIIKEKIQDDISFAAPQKKVASRKGWMIAVLLLFAASTAAAIYYFMKNRGKEVPVTEQLAVAPNSTALSDSISPAQRDSLLKKDSLATQQVKPSNDGYSFKIVIKEYTTKAAAEKAYERLTNYGHKLLLVPIDSMRFKISMPFTSPVADSLRAKDSLRKFFGGNPYVEL